jgi:hypothetical protein
MKVKLLVAIGLFFASVTLINEDKRLGLEICMVEAIEESYPSKVMVEFVDGVVLERTDVLIASASVLKKDRCTIINPHVSLIPKRSSNEIHDRVSNYWRSGKIKRIQINISDSYGGWYQAEDEFTSFKKSY